MLCDLCKNNNAIIHYAEVIGGKVKKLHICEECAKNKGIGVQVPFSIGELLSGLTQKELVSEGVEKATCPLCGMTFSKFKETGRLGCNKCYEVFEDSLISLLSNIHRSTRHVGKVPKRETKVMNVIVKIRDLESKLRNAVENEEYELAAQLRDQMRALEKSSKTGTKTVDKKHIKDKKRRS